MVFKVLDEVLVCELSDYGEYKFGKYGENILLLVSLVGVRPGILEFIGNQYISVFHIFTYFLYFTILLLL